MASDDSLWVNDERIKQLAVDEEYLERERQRETEAARQKVEEYRGNRDTHDLSEKNVIIVDDGLATGATAAACLRQVCEANARRVVLAVPVGAPDTIERLQPEADEMLSVESPPHFSTV